MKKTILSVILALAMLATCALSVFAHNPFTFEVKEYKAAVAKEGQIKIDGECDTVYLEGTRITEDDEACHDGEYFKRGEPYYTEDCNCDGSFEAYIAVDTLGLYVWVNVKDNTMFPDDVLDDNGNSGDYMQLYFDWVPAEDQHPTPAERREIEATDGNPDDHSWVWDYTSYKSFNAASLMYIGWISFDYAGVLTGSGGFAPTDTLGPDFDQAIEYKAVRGENNWSGEVFIPWANQDQKDAVANNKCFPLGIGFQTSDQTFITEEITEDNQHNACHRYDQCQDYGLSYYWDYGVLSDVVWGDGSIVPDNPDTSDSVIAIVATLVVAGAGLAIISKKRG